MLASVLASKPGIRDDRIWPAANSALEKAAKQIFWPVGAVEPVRFRVNETCADRDLARLHLGPKFVIDDAQAGIFRHHPFARIVQSGFTLLSLRILSKMTSVEDDPTDIGLVVQDAAPTITVSTDCSVAPVRRRMI